MNNVKFSSLSVASYLSGSDYITIVRSGSATQSDTGIAPNNYIVQAQYFTSSWANNARTSSYFDADTLFLRQGNILSAAGLNLTMGNNSSMVFYGNNSLMARFVGADGNFGIGSGFATASPAARLHVSSSVVSFPGGHHNNLKLDALKYPTIWFNRTEDNTGFLNAMDYNGFNISSVSSGTPTQRLTINSAGKVGIGTTNPLAKLHVSGSRLDNSARILVTDETGGIVRLNADGYYNNTDEAAGVFLSGLGNQGIKMVSAGVASYITATPTNLGISYAGGPGLSFLTNARMNFWGQYEIVSSGSANFIPLTIIAADNQSSNVISIGKVTTPGSYLTINGAGNVGIGTPTPTKKLHVYDATAAVICIQNPSATSAPHLEFINATQNWTLINRGSVGNQFQLHDVTAGTIPFVVAATNGNVGLGTSTPTNKLSISGSINVPTIVINSSNGLGDWNGIRFGSGYSTSIHEKAGIFFRRINSAADGDLHFAMAQTGISSSTVADSRMVISASHVITFNPANGRDLTPGATTPNAGPSSAIMEISQYRTAPDGIHIKLAGVQALAGNVYSPSVGFGVGKVGLHGSAIESGTNAGLTIDPTDCNFAVGGRGPTNINFLNLSLSTANGTQAGPEDEISTFNLKTGRSNNTTGSPSLTISAKDIDLLTGINYGARVSGLYISASGQVGIGTTAPTQKLSVNGSAGKTDGSSWSVFSDERIKTDIVPADLSRCYDIVKQVGLKYFGFKPGVYNDVQIKDKHILGWIAQDVQKVFDKAVSVNPFTLQTEIPDGIEEYEEQDFTLETVDKVETLIQVINGKPVQVSKVVTSENKVMLFDMVDVLDEAGVAVMESYEVTPAIPAIDATEEVESVMGTRPVTYKMPRMITKTRPKVRREVIEDCLDLNGSQMNAALYGAVQCLMAKVEAQAVTIAALQTKVGE